MKTYSVTPIHLAKMHHTHQINKNTYYSVDPNILVLGAGSSSTLSTAEQVAFPDGFSAVMENRPASSSNTSGMYNR